MNILNFKDVEKYLAHKQVYFRKSIVDINMKTIVKEFLVHNVSDIKVYRLNNDIITLRMTVLDEEIIIHKEMQDLEMFAWIRTNLIPVDILVKSFLSSK